MATKKKDKQDKKPNLDILFKKVDDLNKRVAVLELDIKDIAIEVLEISNESEKNVSLIDRIRVRLGL
jgi:hypothetical protein